MKAKMSNNTSGKRDLMEIALSVIPSMSDEEMCSLALVLLAVTERFKKECKKTNK